MKKNYLFLLTVLYILSSNTDAQNFEWAKSFGGRWTDIGYSIAVDSSGNVYTTGIFEETVDFDPGLGVFNLSSRGVSDIFIQKLDSSGNFVWAKSFGGLQNDRGNATILDAAGNVYTTGYFTGAVDFDPGVGSFVLIGYYDAYVQKLDAAGNFLWAKSFGSSLGEIGNSISVDDLGNVYTTGSFQGTADFDPGVGTANLTSTGGAFAQDVFIQKLDHSGNFLWARSFGADTNDFGQSIVTDASGNVYTAGHFIDTVDFDPGVGTAKLSSALRGVTDVFIQKLDASGNYLWAKSFSSCYINGSNSITVDNLGDVYITGYFFGVVDFDPSSGIANSSSVGNRDAFILKLDSLGNFVWVKTFGGNLHDEGHSVSIDDLGSIYTTGRFKNTVDFDPGIGVANLTNNNAAPDIFIQKLDAAGNFCWARSFSTSFGGLGNSITTDASGNVYTTGYFGISGDFDPSAGTATLTSNGGNDVFIQKMSQVGTTGEIELSPGIQVKAYPNPSKGIVQISFEKAFQNVAITLTDLQGKEVFSKELNATAKEQIEIEGSPGVYFLSIRSKEGQSVIKLIKE